MLNVWCYYKLLNVSKNASLEEIKIAYNRLALKWHHEKNLYSQQQAKDQFQFLERAYRVLSNHQERVRYYCLRKKVLKIIKEKHEGNCLDVHQYMTMDCYADDEDFYAVYREVFEKIAKEDVLFMDGAEFSCVPMFGNSESDYQEVVMPFYNFWMNYSTKKSYEWLDPYDLVDIDRKSVVRWAQQENEMVLQKARKQRNEEVRALVAFVKQHDKRIPAYLKLMKKKKLEQLKLQKKLERRALLLEQESALPEWAKYYNYITELEIIENDVIAKFSSNCGPSLFCDICNKVFKTQRSHNKHKSNRKHQENLLVSTQKMCESAKNNLNQECVMVSDEKGKEEKQCTKKKPRNHVKKEKLREKKKQRDKAKKEKRREERIQRNKVKKGKKTINHCQAISDCASSTL